MQNWREIAVLSLMLFLSIGFIAWRESTFNDRMNEDIREMTARLQQSKMSADQVEVFRSSLLSVKQNISSLVSALGTVIIWIFLSIFIAVNAAERFVGKSKDTGIGSR